jgi:hypothetical protein
MSGPIDLTIPWRIMPRLMLSPAAHAPIENALIVTSGAVPNAYRAKKPMFRWATSRSCRLRIQLYGVPVDPLDSSIVVPA